MKKASVRYEAGLKEDLADPIEVAAYLNAALEDGSQEVFLMALRDVAEARGLTKLAKESTLNRENLYRLLSEKGNPQLSSLNALCLKPWGSNSRLRSDKTNRARIVNRV